MVEKMVKYWAGAEPDVKVTQSVSKCTKKTSLLS